MKYLIFLLLQCISAFNRSDWPSKDTVAPINRNWTSVILINGDIPKDFDADIEQCIQQSSWALTFDDGPAPSTQRNVLEPLAAKKLKATFFVVGQQVADYPEILKRIHQQGHEIGIHTWSHPHLLRLSNDQIIAEIVWTAKIIKELTGVSPKLFRPPCKF